MRSTTRRALPALWASPPPTPSFSSPASRPASLEHRPALDGIRAFAVVAVIAFHTVAKGVPGGYLGVDVFFTLSGYLITALLVAEWGASGTISLRRFWTRRARRLLPALFVMLTGVGVGASVWPQIFSGPSLRGDALATVFQVANWHLIAEHSNYFMVSSHLPLMHTWSLAIEEQFYLVWPVVVLAVLAFGTRRRPGTRTEEDERRARHRLMLLLCVSVAGALASATRMAVITGAGSDTAHSYYASDTRAQALLVGAALALAGALWRPTGGRRSSSALTFAGVTGVLGVVALWAFVPEDSYVAFHGGFLLTALATAGIIACLAMGPRTAIGSFLGLAPIRFVGRISYGMYLWYWPVVLVLSPPRVHVGGIDLLGLRLAVIIAIATLSAYVIELPIRRGRLKTWPTTIVMPVAATMAVLTVFVSTVDVVGASASQGAAAAAPGSARSAAPAPSPATPPGAQGGDSTSRPLLAPLHGQAVKALIVGDSVAGTLGVGLGRLSAQYGVVAVNEGSPGCSVSMDQLVQVLWYIAPPGTPCRQGDPSALLAQWRTWVDQWNPDVVVYLARGELLNQEVGSSWQHIGVPAFDTYLAGRFQDAVNVLGWRGAHVIMLTSPYYDTGVQPSGSVFPEDDPSRVVGDNRLIEQIATALKGTSRTAAGRTVPTASSRGGAGGVTVIDLGAWVSPGGRYATTVDGTHMRCADGVHFTVPGGEWVARRLLPEIAALGRPHQAASPSGSWTGNVAQVAPSWYAKLSCAAA